MKIKVFSSTEQIPKSLWNGILANQHLAFSHEFWGVVERSSMNDFDYRHALLLDDEDNPVALTSFYSVTNDIAIFAPLPLRNLLVKIRRFFPSFLKLRMLEWGTPITISSPPFVSSPGTSPDEVIRHMHKLLLATAKAEGQLLIVARDFAQSSDHLLPGLGSLGYNLVDSLPNTFLDITWSSVEAYQAAMKSYYRSKLLKHLRRNKERHVRHELVDDFEHLADELCAQWMIVHMQADEYQREVLTATFYREFSRSMGTNSKALLFYRQEILIGHALLLQDGPVLRWLYFGRTEATKDSLYFYVAHTVIETAICLRSKKLEMGLTTYSIKQDLGAQPEPIKIAIRATSLLLNPLIGLGYSMLNSTPRLLSKNIFKSQ